MPVSTGISFLFIVDSLLVESLPPSVVLTFGMILLTFRCYYVCPLVALIIKTYLKKSYLILSIYFHDRLFK